MTQATPLPPQPAARPRPPSRGAWLALGLVAIALVGFDLGGLDLWAPDEPRYAEVAEELRRAERGPEDLVLLRLGGEPYTQKPPLYFWLAAGLGALRGGVDEWSARLPSALAGLATLGVWAAIARRLFPGTAVPWMTAALLLTSFRFVHFARRAQLDVMLALFEGLALWGFLEWRGADAPHVRRRALLVLHGASALALLTKGPVGLLPWACFVAVLFSEGRARDIRRVLPLWGIALAAAPALAWIAASVALAPDGFFQAAVVDNLWSRFATGTAHVRPVWYFVRQLPVEALPWSLLWPVALVWAWLQRRSSAFPRSMLGADDAFARRLLVAWVAIPFVFFSLSAGKRGLYLLPALPALCLALAAWLERVRARAGERSWLDGPALPVVLSAAIAAIAAAAIAWRPEGGPALEAFDAGRSSLLGVAAAGAAFGLAAGRASASAAAERRAIASGFVTAWCLVVAVWGVLFFAVLPRLEPEKSPRPIARAATGATAPGERIGLYRQPALLGGLSFYGERPVERIDDEDALAGFVETGGRVVVSRARDAANVELLRSARLVAQLRSGRRAQSVLVVDAPTPAAGDAANLDGGSAGASKPGAEMTPR